MGTILKYWHRCKSRHDKSICSHCLHPRIRAIHVQFLVARRLLKPDISKRTSKWLSKNLISQFAKEADTDCHFACWDWCDQVLIKSARIRGRQPNCLMDRRLTAVWSERLRFVQTSVVPMRSIDETERRGFDRRLRKLVTVPPIYYKKWFLGIVMMNWETAVVKVEVVLNHTLQGTNVNSFTRKPVFGFIRLVKCVSVQYDRSHRLFCWEPKTDRKGSAQIMLIAQSDQSLRWPHIHKPGFVSACFLCFPTV